jgi:hypothetical protein
MPRLKSTTVRAKLGRSTRHQPQEDPTSRSPITCSPFFGRLNEDVRRMINGYLEFPPFDRHDDSSNSGSGFALTCRQARQETAEEGARRLWMCLKQYTKAYETQIPKVVGSPADLFATTSLIIILPTAEAGSYWNTTTHFWTNDLLCLQIKNIPVHVTRKRPLWHYRALFKDVLDLVTTTSAQCSQRSHTFTVFWDFRRRKRDTELEGTLSAFSDSRTEQVRFDVRGEPKGRVLPARDRSHVQVLPRCTMDIPRRV